MKIDSTQFGSIVIEGKTYSHDVIIRRSGKVTKRKKKLSKQNIMGLPTSFPKRRLSPFTRKGVSS